jgi:hypothetical protein
MSKYLFSFWEPASKIPGYIKLCIDTWQKALPDYEIVICDYHNIGQYLDKATLQKILYKKCSLQHQADALRVALLERHGGIWMDADTILTSDKFLQHVTDAECCMIGNVAAGSPHIAFIHAHPGSLLIRDWFMAVEQRISIYRRFKRNPLLKYFHNQAYRNAERWDYFGNSFLDEYIKNIDASRFKMIDRMAIKAVAEYFSPDQDMTTLGAAELYKKFYFSSGQANDTLMDNDGIVLLHNGWTPATYKNMTAPEFLQQDIVLANFFKYLQGK